MPDARPIKEPCRIITEGYADSAFFNALIKARGIANCEAECTRSDKKPQGCAGKVAAAMTDTVRSLVSFSELNPGKLRGIVLAVDIDDDAKKTLEYVKNALKDVKPSVSCPSNYLEIKKEKKKADFAVAIMGIPWHDQLGNLSCLSWNWRGRSSVKITERTYEKRAKTLHRRREGCHPETALVG